jgi:hypothetical protein
MIATTALSGRKVTPNIAFGNRPLLCISLSSCYRPRRENSLTDGSADAWEKKGRRSASRRAEAMALDGKNAGESSPEIPVSISRLWRVFCQ